MRTYGKKWSKAKWCTAICCGCDKKVGLKKRERFRGKREIAKALKEELKNEL